MTNFLSNIPNHLRSTYNLLKRTFTAGIHLKDYFALLAVMQDSGMSSVAEALSHYRKGD